MKKILLLLVMLVTGIAAWGEDYITDVMVIGGSKSETNALKTTYTNQGWTVIDKDLNAGASGDYIFLLYKKASETSSGASFITDFYLSSASGTAPDNLEHNGRTYHISPCDGSDYFKNSKGDLNCHCSGSAYIHLYYTKEYLDDGEDYSTVKSITINNTQAGAVGENGGTTGYDLNSGAGGDYIYMHADKSQGWIVSNGVSTNDCMITGFDGPKPVFTSITIPFSINGAPVTSFSMTLSSEFNNLEMVTLPSSLMEIGTYAFFNCNSLTDIYFDGSQQQWGNVTKGENWKPNATKEHWHCTVAFDANGHGTTPEPQTVWSNQDKVTEPSMYAFGYKFLGWYTEAACTNKWDFNTVVPGDMTLYAKWEESQYDFNRSTGVLTLLWGEFNAANKWDDVPSDAVKSVTATSEVSFTGDCSGLFYGFINCESMDLNNVKTSAVTDMSYMFYNCYWLEELDLSNWDTGNVTNMSNMFSSYMGKVLTSLDVSGWNTSKVTNMSAMFLNSSNLTSLDISGWDVSNVTDMSVMFRNCQKLTSLDVSDWNTSNVTDMFGVFWDCRSLTTLDLSNWDTGNATDMMRMFLDCHNLTTIYVGAGWNTDNVTTSDQMFEDCTNLVGGMGTTYDSNHIDKEYARIDCGINYPGYFTSMMPRYTYNSTTGALVLNLGVFNKDNKWGNDVSPTAVKSVTATSDVSFTGDCSDLFNGFSNCESMDLDKVNTSQMTNCENMFYNCMNLDSLNLTSWNTAKVTDMMEMFDGCTSLTTIYVGSRWSTEKVTSSSSMFDDCNSLVGGMGTTFDASHIDKEYARIDKGPSEPGYLSRVSRYTYNGETGELKLNWGEFNKDNKWGSDVPRTGVKRVTATSDVSFTGDCSELFYGFAFCERMDLSDVNTNNVTDMNLMFASCTSLTSLDISGWETGNVTKMHWMFFDCWRLPSLDLSGWNTSNLTNTENMFCNCFSLSTIYVGTEWSTANVISSSSMFDDCNSLVGGMGTTFDASHIDKEYARIDKEYARIDKGPSEPGYFSSVIPRYTYNSTTGALALNWGVYNSTDKWGDDVPSDAVKSVTATSEVSFTGDCSGLFYGFNNCESMDLNSINTSAVTDMSYMFYNCYRLESLDLSNWDTGNVTNMSNMFNSHMGKVLTSLDVSGWNTSNVTNMSAMFLNSSNLTSLDISGWDVSNVTDMSVMFRNCQKLTSLDVSDWNTSNVTDMFGVFWDCRSLTTLDLSNWDTGNATDMMRMFLDCHNLTTIYVGADWNTAKVTRSDEMFEDCTNLVGGMGTTYDQNHIDKEYARIDGGPECPGYFTAAPQVVIGDVTGEGDVDVSDVNAVINIILHKKTEADYPGNADITGEGNIDVSDVNAIINIILN